MSTIKSQNASIATAPYAPMVRAIASAYRNENAWRRIRKIATTSINLHPVSLQRISPPVAKHNGTKNMMFSPSTPTRTALRIIMSAKVP